MTNSGFSFSPVLYQMQNGVGCFLFLLLVGMAGLFDDNQLVLRSCGHMVVDVFQEPRGITAGKPVIGADEHRAGLPAPPR